MFLELVKGMLGKARLTLDPVVLITIKQALTSSQRETEREWAWLMVCRFHG